MEPHSCSFLSSCEFFYLKNSRQTSSTLLKLKTMSVFWLCLYLKQGMSRLKKVTSFFSSGPVLYGKRKCEVIGSVVVTQSQKVMGWKRRGKNRVPYLCLLGSWAFWPSSCHSLRTVTRPGYGRLPFLTFHPVAPPIYPFHSLGLILGKNVLKILSVAATLRHVFTGTCAVAATDGAGPAESRYRLVQQRLMPNAVVCL